MKKFAVFSILMLTLAVANAQIKLKFAGEVSRSVWVGGASQMTPPDNSATTKTEVELAQGAASKDDFVWVYDSILNNLAHKKISDLKGVWSVTDADFTLLGRTAIYLEHEGKAVASANISIKSGSNSYSGMVAPGDHGAFEVWGLAPGQVTVNVSFRDKGKTVRLSPAPSFDLALKRDDPKIKLTIPIPGNVDVIEPEKPAMSTKPDASKKVFDKNAPAEPKGSIFGSIVIYLIGIGAAAAVIFFGVKWIQKNTDKVDAQLQKVGVSIPKDPDPNAVQTTTVQATPAPVQKIVLPGAEPTIVGGTAVVHTPVAMAVANPRLVGDDGSVILLTESVATLGREQPANLVVADQTISRSHAEIRLDDGVVTVKDLGSSNGSFVNGARLGDDPVQVNIGDQVQFGAVKFRYEK